MIFLSALRTRRLGLLAAALGPLALATPARAAPSSSAGGGHAGGEVLPVQIFHNLYQWCVDSAWWLIPIALIAGVIYHLCIPQRRDVPKAASFLLVMALIIIPCALAAPTVISRLKALGDQGWGASQSSSPGRSGGAGQGGTP